MTVTELLQELIRFDTTNPPGDEAACVEFIRAQLEEAGCETELYAKEPSRPNLSSPISAAVPRRRCSSRGTSTSSRRPGRRGRIRPSRPAADGAVWGRGALDMKAGVAMLADAFLRAKRENVALPGDLVLLVLADEENGGDLGARFLVEEHPELFAGMRYAR